MTIRKRAGSVLFTAAAAAAVVGMSVGPALAATHLTVKVTHGGKYTATASTTTLKDGQIAVICSTVGKVPSSKGSGKLASGTYHGTGQVSLGKVKGLVFNNCTSLGNGVTATVMKEPTLNADSKTTNNRNGDTDAIITNVDVNVKTTSCSFTVTGSAPGYYSNKTHTLTMKSGKLPTKALKKAQLTVSNVSGCVGLVNNHDHPTYNATYKISLKKLTIKSS